MATPACTNTITVSKSLLAGLAVVAGLGLMGGAFALGMAITPTGNNGLTTAAAPPVTAGTTTTTTIAGSGTAPPTGGPFSVGTTVNFRTPVVNLAGQLTTLARGSKGTVIMAMASWCLYCGYEDKWALPPLANTPGVDIDIVDVSPQGGIADPGPQSPAFSGHDGTGGAISLTGMASVMRQYKQAFGTLNASNIHVYAAPSATQTAWNVQSFPTLAFVGANGKVAVAPAGAQTISQAQNDLQQAMGH